MSEDIKQVLVVRSDLKMPKGKEDSQAGHAALAFIGRRIRREISLRQLSSHLDPPSIPSSVTIELNQREALWFMDIYTKVTLVAHDEAELLEVERLAKEAGLETHLITDAGLTCFDGKPTHTFVAIGPDYASKIDAITGPNGTHPLRLR